MAIVVSVFGTMISMTKLDEMGVTGFLSTSVNESGKGNVSVKSSVGINLTDALIQIGGLNVGQYNDSETVGDWWAIKNDGSVNFSVELYGPQTAIGQGPFASGTGGCLDATPMTCFMVRCNSSGSGTCSATYRPLNKTDGTVFLDDLHPTSGDTATFYANVTVPPNEQAGNKEQAVYFYAQDSS